MAIGVGAGDYAEYLPFVPPPGGGPAFLFIDGGTWVALLASDETTWEFRDGAAGGAFGNSYAADADNLEGIFVNQNSEDSDSILNESDDGGVTSDTTTTPAALPGLVNVLVLIHRDGAYRIQVFDNSNVVPPLLGGEYSSADAITWTKTDRVNSRFFKTSVDPAPLAGDVWPADMWCATEDHAYYVLREDNSFGGMWRSIYVDAEVASGPTVYRLAYPQPADSPPWEPPTGGTFLLSLDGVEWTDPIAWNASAATILTELQALSNWVGTGSASGSFGTHIEITDGEDGFKPQLDLDPTALTSAGPDTPTIFSDVESIGQMGVGTFVTDPAVGSPVHSFNEMWGSFTGDVALVYLDIDSDPKLWKLVNTAAPDDVTPGFFTTDCSVDKFISPDGVTWLGIFTDDEGGAQLMRSTNSGDTWALVGPVVANIIHVVFDPAVANRWWALLDIEGSFTETELYVSTDNGATWADFGADTYFIGFFGADRIAPLGGRTN